MYIYNNNNKYYYIPFKPMEVKPSEIEISLNTVEDHGTSLPFETKSIYVYMHVCKRDRKREKDLYIM